MVQIRLLGTTAILTLFIWVSADQLLTERVELSIGVKVQAEPNSAMVVRAAPSAPSSFVAVVSGTKAGVTALRESGVGQIVLSLRDDAIRDGELGLRNVALLEELRANESAFGECTLLSVRPTTIPVILDRYIEVDFPVRVRPGNLDYSVAPRVDPETVRVVILQSEHDQLADGGAHVRLDAESFLKNQPEAKPVSLQVPLEPKIEADQGAVSVAEMTPDVVTLRATLRQRLVRGTINAIPIRFLASPNVHRAYRVEHRVENPDETLRLDVIGPPEVVGQLTSGEIKVSAVIALSSPDPFAESSYQFYTPQFDLPPGVSPAEDQQIPAFEIRLVPRSAPKADAAGSP